jgi:hypothetical protein
MSRTYLTFGDIEGKLEMLSSSRSLTASTRTPEFGQVLRIPPILGMKGLMNDRAHATLPDKSTASL